MKPAWEGNVFLLPGFVDFPKRYNIEREDERIMELKKGISYVGILDRNLRVFDIIMETEFGTTYNSYVVQGTEKTALIETAKAPFFEEYRKKIEAVTDIGKIDYLVMDHTEPDHAGSAAKLLELNPGIEVVATTGAINFLGQIMNRPFKSRAVKEGEEIDLGGKTLRFMIVPNLHWPDTMYTYIPEDKTLFTCDSFGSHYCCEGILRSKVEDEAGYLRAAKYYFDNILGPFKPFMNKALDRVEKLDVDMICPGHGPVLDTGLKEFYSTYREWSKLENPNQNKTVVIAYVSAYGYTAMMAKEIAEGVRAQGVDVRLYDLVTDDCSELPADLLHADGILLGSPTILSDALKPVYDLSTTMLPTIHGGKQAAAFGSYGWTGEAVPNLTQRLQQLKMKVSEGLRLRFMPSPDELAQCRAFGEEFAGKVKG